MIDPAKRPPVDVWMPTILTADGLKDTAQWYREAGWL
jgi:UDP-glucose 4-epimerase